MVLLRRDGMSLQAQTSLFQSLLNQPFCRPFKIHKGDTFVVQGESANQLFLINNCDFSVSYLTPAGKRYIVNSQRGFTGVLGEMEVFRPEGRYVFSVTALNDANGYQISRAKLLEAVAQQPDMALNFLQLVTGRYEESIGHTLSNILYTLRFNIIRVMLNKSAEANDGWFEFKTDQHASELGATTRAFRRVVKDLVDEGVVDKKRSTYRIANLDALKNELEDC
ncbi:Crp/Fnr family transcriptional regulator [Enterovibrio sp. ZSDZ35]|uniref:Crp/Fnr family transcriptional regulator n=1 Tax=Enterovibrio qingdaonensis TaxID=2899818 RepID=A0ABT5QNF6_9GAMM|nr:Crp/Fnr family transcriptional regulator [Enterovibrio sp. ZSDZ35]MDD1782531.1 Crp/Fnr family transcriptional regulator [Enterovibrio sp. ZSDZ35]